MCVDSDVYVHPKGMYVDYVCLYRHVYVYMYIRLVTCIHTCIHTYVRTYVRTYIHTYMRTRAYRYVHKYIHICIYAYAYRLRWSHTTVLRNDTAESFLGVWAFQAQALRKMFKGTDGQPSLSSRPEAGTGISATLLSLRARLWRGNVGAQELPISWSHIASLAMLSNISDWTPKRALLERELRCQDV